MGNAGCQDADVDAINALRRMSGMRQLFQTGGGLGGGNGGGIATKVVCLTEVVTADELKDDEEYEDILEDMRVEGGKFGTLMNIVIPRPQPNGEPSLGLGKAFVENYDTSCIRQCLYGIIYHYVSHNRC
ncbi:splicing factor U2af large subunit A-like [Papaver somniferum]|uniref:splicing factor U2af large subunit A-like n=1 Tax=Papaver somniferum TaxID=3469 RepID=UPI000E700B65|nr:splicing factor U2af large subunit A-like [Papaver somniferum]